MCSGLDAEVGHLLLDDARVAPLSTRGEPPGGDRPSRLPVESSIRAQGEVLRERELVADEPQRAEEAKPEGRRGVLGVLRLIAARTR